MFELFKSKRKKEQELRDLELDTREQELVLWELKLQVAKEHLHLSVAREMYRDCIK